MPIPRILCWMGSLRVMSFILNFIDPNPGFNVKNWFLDESEELTPDLYYSLWDTVGDLKENLSRLWEDATFEKRVHYELFKLINRRSSAFDETKVKEVNEKLMKIKKV